MAQCGLVEDILGHLSLRLDADRALLRCRGPHERGLRFTTPADIRVVDLDGRVLDDPTGAYQPPSEAPIHTETLRHRPDVHAVVHVHPPAVVVAALATLPLRPIFGSYDIPAARLAADGIPVHPRSVLIRRADLAGEMLASMGTASVCVLAGHGLVATGPTVEDAMLRALAVDRLARISLAVVQAGGELRPIPDADLAELPDLGASFNRDVLWRHHLAALAADGADLTEQEQAP